MNSDEDKSLESDEERATQSADDVTSVVSAEDDGPGWMPAVLAATLLMGIIGFIACGFTTWLLFEKRAEMALRTMEGSYIPEIEQSRLNPDEKREVLEQLRNFAKELEQGKYENWQAAAVMQRLVRLPVIQWGEMRVVEAYLERSDRATAKDDLRELSRLKRAVELGGVTSFDVEDALKPVFEADDSSMGRRLLDPLNDTIVDDVVNRAKLISDRSEVPDKSYSDVQLAKIVRKEIELGLSQGGF